MHHLSGLSLRKRSVVLLATVLIAVLGVFGITRLQTELIPDINFPVLTVVTTDAGAAPEAVDADVTLPIVNAISGLPGISTVQSTSSQGSSFVIAQFDFGTNMADRQQALTSALAGVHLPSGTGQPDVERININQFPVVSLALTGANGNLATLRKVAQQQFVPALGSVDGVSRVEVTGGSDDIVQIGLDPTKMAAANITTQQVASVLQANNLSVPAGTVNTSGTTLPVRVGSQLDSLDALKSLVVGAQPAAGGAPAKPVTLGEIGNVQITPAGLPGVSRTDGKPSVAINVYLNQGANTVDVASGVRSKLDEVSKQLGANSNVSWQIIEDQSTFINQSIHGLVREAALGAVFAILVIFAFLLSVRSTLVTAISIPLSLLIAFILLWVEGISLNILTLGAIAIAVGRVVDDAIVVLESIYRYVQRGLQPRQAAYEGTKEVAMAITASSLTTIAVFLPLGFVGGLVGELFKPFALTVTFALLASLIVALTVVPVLASFFINADRLRPLGERESLLRRVYGPILRLALRRPWRTLAIVAALFILSLGLTPFIGTSFLPSGGPKVASITVQMPAGTAQEATVATATKLEQVVRNTAKVTLLQTQVGGEGLQAVFTGASNSQAIMTVTFDQSVNLPAALDTLRQKLPAAAPAADITVAQQSGGFGGSSNSVQVTVQGNDYAQVSKVAQDLTPQIAKVKNVVNVSNDVTNAKPELDVTVDPAKALAIGTTTAQIGQQVSGALSGIPAGQLTVNGVTYPVSIDVAGAGNSVAALQSLPVGTAHPVPLSQVATVSQGSGPVQVVRVDGKRAATITGTITTDTTGGVTADVQKILHNYHAPQGVTITLGGVSQQQGQAFASLGIALLVAVALVYIVMVASFGTLSTPFVILFSLPLAAIGVLVALFVTGKSIGLPALIGVLMLVGIVVTNAIVLLELVLDLWHHGMPMVDAIIEGGKTRARPVLMTAMATILALIPLALSKDSGAIIASDLAVVVIGGLLTATLLTLIVVPVLFELIVGRSERWAAKRAAKAANAALEPVAAGHHDEGSV